MWYCGHYTGIQIRITCLLCYACILLTGCASPFPIISSSPDIRGVDKNEVVQTVPTETISLVETQTANAVLVDPLSFPKDTPNPSRLITVTPSQPPKPSSTPTLLLLTATPTISPTPSGLDCLPLNAQQTPAKVTQVLDGDTIEVEIEGKVYQVRYIGINTPELKTDKSGVGQEALQMNQTWLEGLPVILVRDISNTDRYQRLLRYVVAGGVFINLELVRAGLATATPYPPDIACQESLLAAQNQARQELAGIWKFMAATAEAAQETAQNDNSDTRGNPGGYSLNTPGSNVNACNCTGPDLDCKDFKTRAAAQSCFDYCIAQGYGDIFRLDGDHDNRVCETKP